MSYTLRTTLSFGTSKAGLTDLRAQLFDSAGADTGSPIATGFVDKGSGIYWWTATMTSGFVGGATFYSNAAPTVILGGMTITPAEFEYIDAAISSGGSGATAAVVWQYGQRTLTQPGTSVINSPTGDNLLCVIATTFSHTWSGLAVAIGGTEQGALMFTAKKTLSTPDSTALLQVLVTVAADAGDGLQRYMGLAAGALKTKAALVGDVAAGTVRLDVEDDVTLLLTAQKVYYDVKQMLADGSSSILVSGIFEAAYTPTMTINL